MGPFRLIVPGSCLFSASWLLALFLLSLIPQYRMPLGFSVIWDQLPSVCPHAVHAGIHTGALRRCAFSTLSPKYLVFPTAQESPHTAATFPLFPFLKEIERLQPWVCCCPLPATVQLNFGGGETHGRALHSQEVAPHLCAAVREPNALGWHSHAHRTACS